jgi:hypothetical protein|tara:strand:+ start:237 stop:626 length:390 start_codon:yes stop_codon:yes gene_type:complete
MDNKLINDVMVQNIINNINNIYENLNICSAFFISAPELLSDINNLLLKNDYPITTLDNTDKFINNLSRILLIDNTQINDIYNNIELINSMQKVNLIIFIETPKINDNDFYKNFFNITDFNDTNINIFEL